MNNKKVPVLSIVLYVLSGLVAIFAIWAVVVIHTSIIQQQVKFSGNEFNIIDSYMVNAGLYLVLAVILFTLGWIYQQFAPLPVKKETKPDDQEQYETVSVEPVEDVYSGENTTGSSENAAESNENSDK